MILYKARLWERNISAAYSKVNQAMYDSLLTVEDSIENINTPKERQYILINNRK